MSVPVRDPRPANGSTVYPTLELPDPELDVKCSQESLAVAVHAPAADNGTALLPPPFPIMYWLFPNPVTGVDEDIVVVQELTDPADLVRTMLAITG